MKRIVFNSDEKEAGEILQVALVVDVDSINYSNSGQVLNS